MFKARENHMRKGDICNKTSENLNLNFFLKKKKGGKTVIYGNSLEKSWDFSRSWMMKWTVPLELSHEI